MIYIFEVIPTQWTTDTYNTVGDQFSRTLKAVDATLLIY